MGLKRLKYDTCVYYKMENFNIIVAVYVDDLYLCFNYQGLVGDVKQQIFDDFRMKDLGQAKRILGLRVRRRPATRSGTSWNCSRYSIWQIAISAGRESATDEDDETTK